jgi:hypothetical protein
MRRQYLDKPETALVILFPHAKSPLWDSDVRAFMASVEGKLDNVYVTHASAGQKHPTLKDALTAARFFGSASAVVVDISGGVVPVEDAAWPLPFTLAESLREPDSVAETYRACASLHEPAACA